MSSDSYGLQRKDRDDDADHAGRDRHSGVTLYQATVESRSSGP